MGGTGAEIGSENGQTYRLACLELRGGNQRGSCAAGLPGLNGWVSCRPLHPAPHGGDMEWSWRNPQLIASLFAILVCAATKRQLLTIVAGLTAFFAWQLLL